MTDRTDAPPKNTMRRGDSDLPPSEQCGEDGEFRSSYAASLVQSAAKSLLDTSTSLVSDDDDLSSVSQGGIVSPTLRSLERKTLPALPDEQDRKRFIGCLAAILASSYEYDFNIESLDEDEDDVTDSFAYFDLDEDEDAAQSEASISHANSAQSFDSSTDEKDRTSMRSNRDFRRNRKRDSDLMNRARNRHRQRRYELFSDLLLSTSDLLLLEKGQAKAFMPMLTRLLVPPTKSAEELKESQSIPWLRRSQSNTSNVSTSQHGSRLSRHSSDVTENGGNYPSDPSASSFAETKKRRKAGIQLDPNKDEKDRFFLLEEMDDSDFLRPFLESLSPGAGFRCLSLMLLQHLLRSQEGYDARVRHVFKKIGVIVLVHEMDRDMSDFSFVDGVTQQLSNEALVDLATRKFEALEHGIASKLIRLSEIQRKQRGRKSEGRSSRNITASSNDQEKQGGVSRRQIVRGIKIGSAGLVAGTLFAVTGGLAAPGIAAGVAAIAGSTAATAAIVTLTSTAAVTAIFGVGGGSLAAYKMQRRTRGLTEFGFTKETEPDESRHGRVGKVKVEAELFSTVCISGWLRDHCDFQRPWGVVPTNPRIRDNIELLERFYSVHRPDHLSKCSRILSNWRGEEKELWKLLREKYGRDPDHLFPLESGPRKQAALTHEQDELLNQLFVELGHESPEDREKEEASPIEKLRLGWKRSGRKSARGSVLGIDSKKYSSKDLAQKNDDSLQSSLRGPHMSIDPPPADGLSSVSSGFESVASSAANTSVVAEEQTEKKYTRPRHLLTVWDYQSTYGGELYTVKWESEMLMELSDSATALGVEVLEKASAQVLKQTAFATLLSAVALPAVLVSAANMIDGTWTLACERADEAGKELAKSLLFSLAGRRPVTLVGFSMGARVIYACLKELARYQEKWEDAQEKYRESNDSTGVNEGKSNVGDESMLKMREPASIVEDAILMGNPNHLNMKSWVACRQVVSGRLVNCYSRKDLVLSIMFQYKRLAGVLRKVCGTNPIKVPGVENYDVSDLVSGHDDYCVATGKILKRVRLGQPFRNNTNPGMDGSESA